jgi:hypothetical protein
MMMMMWLSVSPSESTFLSLCNPARLPATLPCPTHWGHGWCGTTTTQNWPCSVPSTYLNNSLSVPGGDVSGLNEIQELQCWSVVKNKKTVLCYNMVKGPSAGKQHTFGKRRLCLSLRHALYASSTCSTWCWNHVISKFTGSEAPEARGQSERKHR